MAADEPGPSPGTRPAPGAEPVRPEVTRLDVTEVTENAGVEVTQPYPAPAYPQQPYPQQPYPQQPPAAQPAAPQQTFAQTPYAQAPYAQPLYPPPAQQSPYPQQPYYGWATQFPQPAPAPRLPRRAIAAAAAIIVVAACAVAGGLELAKTTSGSAAQPTTGSAAEDAAVRAVWRTTPVNQLLPPTITREGTESYIRLGINPDESCASLPSAFIAALAPNKCAHLLTATYVDRTQTVTATVGIVVLSGTTLDRLRLYQGWDADPNATDSAMMPHVYPVPATVAGTFRDNQRVAWHSQLSVDGTYLAYAVTGFTDGRPGPGAAAIASSSGSALSPSSPPVQVASDLPAALQDLLKPKLEAAEASQGGTS